MEKKRKNCETIIHTDRFLFSADGTSRNFSPKHVQVKIQEMDVDRDFVLDNAESDSLIQMKDVDEELVYDQ